jgi:hypothetical protein
LKLLSARALEVKAINRKANNAQITEKNLADIDFFGQRVAESLLYFEDNLQTAKSDYISLIGLLLKKGVIFEGE